MAEQDDTTTGGSMIRRRFSFPKADESTLQWWEMQADPSLSVRMLIRAEIEREGYTDYVNRPAVQKPRPGRPPKTVPATVTESGAEEAPDPRPAPAEPAQTPEPEPVAEAEDPVETPDEDTGTVSNDSLANLMSHRD